MKTKKKKKKRKLASFEAALMPCQVGLDSLFMKPQDHLQSPEYEPFSHKMHLKVEYLTRGSVLPNSKLSY